MDPLGFALENFDADRPLAHRATPARRSTRPARCRRHDVRRPGRACARCCCSSASSSPRPSPSKLLTYALGRGVEYYDLPAVRRIARDAAPDDYRWSSLILGIVKSAPFQMRRSRIMIITKKAIPRRTVLRGLGTALALPLLDSMVPALSALRRPPRAPVRRFGVVYAPNGMVMPSWTPATEGADFELSADAEAARAVPRSAARAERAEQQAARELAGRRRRRRPRPRLDPVPDRACIPKRAQGSDISAGMSIDQIAAAEFGKQTQLASLELALEGRDFAGSCDAGYSCAYTNTISWRSATTPLPMENNPRAVFERLFGDGAAPIRRRGAPHRGRPQHPRLGHRADRRSEPAARAARPRQARRVPRGGPRHRAAHPEGRGAERPRAAGHGRSAGRHPRRRSRSTRS